MATGKTKRTTLHAEGSIWQNASELDDIFPLILAQLEFQSRVRDVVLVCKRWSALCLANPPQSRFLTVRVEGANPSYLSWVAKSIRLAKDVEVDCRCDSLRLPKLALSQTLVILAAFSSKLKALTIRFPNSSPGDYDCKPLLKRQGYDWDHCAGCLPLFRRLDTLVLENVRFLTHEYLANEEPDIQDAEDSVPQEYFRGMALKALHIKYAEEHYEDRMLHTISLGNSLRALSGTLTRLELELKCQSEQLGHAVHEPAIGYHNLGESICHLTAIRSLQLNVNLHVKIPTDISKLCSLTSLSLRGYFEHHERIATLSSLQSLDFWFRGKRFSGVGVQPLIPPQLTGLTKLQLAASGQFKQEDMPALLPAPVLSKISNLVDLRLHLGLDFIDLDPNLVRSVSNVTRLDLSGCGFTHIPDALTNLSELRALGLVRARPVQLTPDCVGVLRQLPSLRELILMKGPSDLVLWSTDAYRVMHGLPAEFPDLHVCLE